ESASDSQVFRRLSGFECGLEPVRPFAAPGPGIAFFIPVLHRYRLSHGDCLAGCRFAPGSSRGPGPARCQPEIPGCQAIMIDCTPDPADDSANLLLLQGFRLPLKFVDLTVDL